MPASIKLTSRPLFTTHYSLITAYCSLITLILSSCSSATATPAFYPTYDPFMPIPQETIPPVPGQPTITLTNSPQPPTVTREPTPTRVPVTLSLPTAIPTDQPAITPTPDAERVLPTPRQSADQYVVQAGDTLGDIALRYGISVQDLMQANNITNADILEIGTTLNVPAPNPVDDGTSFKIIPDSEMVNGPATIYFDIEEFIDSQNGYLETYEQDIGGVILSGYEIVYIVSRNYSVNPRLLLALLEYQSGWVTNPAPYNTSYPMGLASDTHFGLYRQLTWAADNLNQGYYLWRANAVSTWVLNDGTVVPVDPTINAGTAAIQYFFAQLDDYPTWQHDVDGTGLLLTYYVFFGNPFNFAVEPLVPSYLSQPVMNLPFSAGETWYFTGGPHGGWDSGSAWAALDFAPPGENHFCETSPYWVTAVADGLVLRASNGALIQDLDNDGYEQTGWVILYMHVAEENRAEPGEYLFAGEQVGHPSCEGGVSNATHLHIARKYNGEWIAADGLLPFNLNGWISSGGGYEYDGYLTRGNLTIEALDRADELNQVYR
ncbi:MAG: LysM peptidoglycan-binding domain-containing protein [Chloroflexi bacterium]|nr:LysM peptidoglycan-binding domain-containing protein [Chloroflexota bacterium]